VEGSIFGADHFIQRVGGEICDLVIRQAQVARRVRTRSRKRINSCLFHEYLSRSKAPLGYDGEGVGVQDGGARGNFASAEEMSCEHHVRVLRSRI
jgi:hypothetical protein